jgi:hypothetical protein
MRTVLTATKVFLEIESRGPRGERKEARCATDKISVRNGHTFSKDSLERGEKGLL